MQNCKQQTQNSWLLKDMVVSLVWFCFSLSLIARIITGITLCSDHAQNQELWLNTGLTIQFTRLPDS